MKEGGGFVKWLLLAILTAPVALLAAPAETKLAVINPAFAQFDDGPAEAHDQQFVPGETIFFRCQVAGYKRVEKEYASYNVHLTFHVVAEDAHGVPLLAAQDGKIETTLSQEDKEWAPKIRYKFQSPSADVKAPWSRPGGQRSSPAPDR